MAVKTFDEDIIPKTVIKVVVGIIIFIFLIVTLFNTFYTIDAGHRGVLLTFGEASMVAQREGLHMKVPYIQNIVIMNVQTQKYEADLTASSKDLQDVNTKIAINYHIIPEQVPEIYRDIGVFYAEKVIYPLEQEINKEATAHFTAEELITKRNEVREMMIGNLKTKLQLRGIIVEEISIINFQFSDAFTQAIENKVTMEQNALASKNKLEQIKFEAQQRIEEAKGKAEAINIEGEALRKNENIMQIRIIEKWNGVLPVVTGGSTPFVDVTKIISNETV